MSFMNQQQTIPKELPLIGKNVGNTSLFETANQESLLKQLTLLSLGHEKLATLPLRETVAAVQQTNK